MDLLMRYCDDGPKTPEGMLDYVGGHLQGSREALGLARIEGYLCRDGQVPPLVADPDLWRLLGWDPDLERLPPAVLLAALTRGEDGQGRSLNASRSLYRAPKELLVTVPCEVSVALRRMPPQGHADVMRSLHQAVVNELCAQALPVQVNGSRTWQSARLLTLGYWHTENRDGEPHDHLHVMVFPPALNGAAQWRTFRQWLPCVPYGRAGGRTFRGDGKPSGRLCPGGAHPELGAWQGLRPARRQAWNHGDLHRGRADSGGINPPRTGRQSHGCA